MLRREWRWENASDVETMEGPEFGDLDNKIEIEVRINLPSATRKIRPDTKYLGPVHPLVFAAFVEWLYHGFAGFGLNNNSLHQVDATTLIQLWVFAGKVGVKACQNACLEGIELWRQNSNTIQTCDLSWIYENAEGGYEECRLKRLLIDQCAWRLDAGWVLGSGMDTDEDFPRQALVDLVGAMRLLLDGGKKIDLDEAPFLRLESRKKLYWLQVEEERVAEVLERPE